MVAHQRSCLGASRPSSVPERRGSVRVDKETGELIYKESGRAFIDPKTKKERIAEDTVSLISETKDARTLSSGTIQENLYADFSNKLKAMAAQARKEAVNMKGIQRDPEGSQDICCGSYVTERQVHHNAGQ